MELSIHTDALLYKSTFYLLAYYIGGLATGTEGFLFIAIFQVYLA